VFRRYTYHVEKKLITEISPVAETDELPFALCGIKVMFFERCGE